LADDIPREPPDGRQKLIETAFRLFAERGFDGVTVRDIASAGGVSIGLINHHFGSKEGLREAVDVHFMAQFEEVLTASPDTDQATSAQLETWVDDWIGHHRTDWSVTVGYLRRALLEESDWGARVFARFYQIAQTTIARMDARGEIRPDVDRLWLPFLFIFLELGTSLLDPHIARVLGRSGFDDELWRRRHRAYLSLIRRGVLPQSEPSARA
jgi:AcrR family transcriptional regulator